MGDINWAAWLVAWAWLGAISRGSRDCDGEESVGLLSIASGVMEGSASERSSLFPSVCRRFSRPSTRFSRASRTSVLGPLFFGTASAGRRQLAVCKRQTSLP
jgi:hypothetical protein